MPHKSLAAAAAAMLALVVTASLVGATSASAAAGRYRLSLVGALDGSGGTCAYNTAEAVNTAGAVVGSGSTASSFGGHGYVLRSGQVVDLYGLGGPSAREETSASGVNDLGDVVGRSQLRSLPDSPPHAVIWRRGGTPVDLGTGYAGTEAFSAAADVNSAGTVVGSRSVRQSAPETAVSWVGGQVRGLPGLGGTAGLWGTTSAARAIGDDGLVVGEALPRTVGAGVHAVTWRNGVVKDLGMLVAGGEYSRALGVNDLGVVVGESSDVRGVSGFRWVSGTMQRLPSLAPGIDWPYATAEDVNDSGVAVGTSGLGPDADYVERYAATLWSGGAPKNLNSMVVNPIAGLTLSFGRGISDKGVVVGTAEYTAGTCKGQQRGFVLTPTT